MAAVEIEGYQLQYHPNGCRYRIKAKGGQWSALIPVTATDFAALAAVLKEKPVYFMDGWIYTGPEPTGN